MDKEIIMGCCEPVLGPIQNYYTKFVIDRKLEEISSAITSGCCITPEQVDEKIEEAISGISISGVTEEELNNAIESAKTEIEAEMPVVPTSNTAFTNDAGYLTEHQSLSGYATEQWVTDQHYITGVDLSNYSTTEQMNVAISAATDGLATENYVNSQISSQTSNFVTGVELSSYTYDKATIDEKVAQGGTFDPTQYYNKTATDALLAEKLDTSAYTPVDLSAYALKTDIPTSNSAFTNDMNYVTSAETANYVTSGNVETQITNHFWCGTQSEYNQLPTKENNVLYLIHD